DVAVCCVPNAGRIYPYYVKSMWLRTPKGLLCALYGASELSTEVNGAKVHIVEQTNYPFVLSIAFSIDVSQPVEFELAFRKPAWAIGFDIHTDGKWQEENGVIKVHKTWQAGDTLVLQFQAKVKTDEFHKDEYFISYGPLVFARPLNGQAKEGRSYPVEGLRDLYYSLDDSSSLADLPDTKDVRLEQQPFHAENPWETLHITIGSKTSSKLVPMGASILRQITFRKSIT
ncbi:MAG TPA: glycoside hydrolase family 127 protein, partial [Anaerolineales bacterium]|nr:glycoside hydrolase family 127 protein [Anaerolineales bacterium]